MAQGRKGRLNYRGLRCSFVGDKKEVQRLNTQFREKYIDRMMRITDF